MRYLRRAYTDSRVPLGCATFTSILRNAPEGPAGVGRPTHLLSAGRRIVNADSVDLHILFLDEPA